MEKGLWSVFDVGKYKGQTINSVIDSNVSYIQWCLANMKGFRLTIDAYKVYIKKAKKFNNYKKEKAEEEAKAQYWLAKDPECKLFVYQHEYNYKGEPKEGDWSVTSFENIETGEFITGSKAVLQKWFESDYDPLKYRVYAVTSHRDIYTIGTTVYTECSHDKYIIKGITLELSPYYDYGYDKYRGKVNRDNRTHPTIYFTLDREHSYHKTNELNLIQFKPYEYCGE